MKGPREKKQEQGHVGWFAGRRLRAQSDQEEWQDEWGMAWHVCPEHCKEHQGSGVCSLLMRTRSTGFRSQLILYDVLFAELMLFPNKVTLLVNFLPLQPRTLKNSLTGSGLLWLLVSEAEAQAYCSDPSKACSRGAWSSQPRAAEVSRRGWPWTFSIAVDGV